MGNEMRKFLFVLVFSGFSIMAYAQNKPEYGNWSLGLGGGASELRYLSRFIEQERLVPNFNLHFEKHHSPYFSMIYAYGLVFDPGFPLNANHLAVIPTLNLRSQGRFVFSLGARVGGGFFNDGITSQPILALNHVVRFRLLLGSSKGFRKDYKGEINLVFEPFYFRQTESDYWGFNRQVRLDFIIPLSK